MMPIVPVPGSDRQLIPRSIVTGPAMPEERLEVTLFLKSDIHTDADAAAITSFADAHGLKLTVHPPVGRTIAMSGTVADMEKAFGVKLQQTEYPGGTYRARVGEVHLPVELAGIVQAILGLDNRPQAVPHFRRRPESNAFGNLFAHASQPGFTAPQLAKLYNFPTQFDGTGVTVGIVALGGTFYQSDLATYCQTLGIKQPVVKILQVDGAVLSPSDADVETALDVQTVAGVAPGCTIIVAFAPNTDRGFLDAFVALIQAGCQVVSVSWGSAESQWTGQAMVAFDQTFDAAIAKGVSFFSASGDNGSSDGLSGDNVDFPSSSPWQIACGGTTLVANGGIKSETVWGGGADGGATGGGISRMFARPTYQAIVNVPGNGRCIPDLAADASPETGHRIVVQGQWTIIGGTSAVAPMYAGLAALMCQGLGRGIGNVHPQFYSTPGVFRDILVGSNGDFNAGPGFDCCTGLGVIDGTAGYRAIGGIMPTPAPPPLPPPVITPVPPPVIPPAPVPPPVVPPASPWPLTITMNDGQGTIVTYTRTK